MTKKMKKMLLAACAIALCIGAICAYGISPFAKKQATLDPATYVAVFDATYYAAANPDLAAAGLTTETQLLSHFVNYGMKEGRQGNEEFNVNAYRNRYPDLNAAFGDDLKSYYMHYINYGKAEGRNGKADGTVTTAATTGTTATTASTTGATHGTVIGANGLAWCNRCEEYVKPSVYQSATTAFYCESCPVCDNTLYEEGVTTLPVTVEEHEKWMFDVINQQRAKKGISPLIWDANMAAASRVRAQDCNSLKTVTHTRPNASPYGTEFTGNNAASHAIDALAAQYNTECNAEMLHYGENTYFNSQAHINSLENAHYAYAGVGYCNGYYCVWLRSN